MKIAYVDSSCFLAVTFCEPGYRELLDRLSRLDLLFSSVLLESEVRAAMAREGVDGSWRNLFSWVTWVQANRRLTSEMNQILAISAPRGADLWHLASALFVRTRVPDLGFMTLDRNQRSTAQSLGFPVL